MSNTTFQSPSSSEVANLLDELKRLRDQSPPTDPRPAGSLVSIAAVADLVLVPVNTRAASFSVEETRMVSAAASISSVRGGGGS